MDEFAMGCTSEYSAFGPAKHPLLEGLSPGGSSGGSAAAVRGGMAHAALGSDTGGSVRQPAALCGVCGFRPTYGRISRYGLIAFASSLDQIGIIAPEIETIALIFDNIKGKDSKDASSVDDPVKSSPISSPKFAYLTPDDICTPEIMHSYTNAISSVNKAFECERHHLNYQKFALPAYHIISSAEASSNLARYDGRRFGAPNTSAREINKFRAENFGPEVKRRIMLGTFVLSEGYSDRFFTKAQKVRRIISSEYYNCFNHFDYLLTPTVPFEKIESGIGKKSRIDTYHSDYYTAGPSLAGLPAATIPIDSTSEIFSGLQIVGPKGSDEELLKTASQISKIVS
jgi:aspartyl-tRNA(Asn)/glutamyl-tRNA(Gln) amidotransferase subunit A